MGEKHPVARGRGVVARNHTTRAIISPAGPGSSGVSFVRRKGQQLRAIVGEDFHLLGFDLRGVHGSWPLASCYPDNDAETRRRLVGLVRDSKPLEDSADIYAWTRDWERACADTAGRHGRYVNTPQTAADLNSILAAVGQAGHLVYWGFIQLRLHPGPDLRGSAPRERRARHRRRRRQPVRLVRRARQFRGAR